MFESQLSRRRLSSADDSHWIRRIRAIVWRQETGRLFEIVCQWKELADSGRRKRFRFVNDSGSPTIPYESPETRGSAMRYIIRVAQFQQLQNRLIAKTNSFLPEMLAQNRLLPKRKENGNSRGRRANDGGTKKTAITVK